MAWLEFAAASALVVVAAVKLAEYGDVISERTGLGGMFIGTLLMAGATSLPELLTTINSLDQDVPNLAAGNLFGSNMFDMLLLAVLDLMNQQARILRLVATRHALTASLLIGTATFFILADMHSHVGWVGLGSLLLMVLYLVGVWLIRRSSLPQASGPPAEVDAGLPPLSRGLLGFSAASLVLLLVTPWLVRTSVRLADITGVGTGFVGTALLGTVTSLPELVAVLAAARIGAYDLAVGNLFGSNVFNMFVLGLADLFYVEGLFLEEVDLGFALAGIVGLALTNLGLIGNLARVERRLLIVEVDALVILVVYFAGLWFLFQRGVGL